MADDRILWPGDTVEPDVGPVRCSHPKGESGVCTGLVGWPAVGAELAVVHPPGERLEACEPGFSAFRCHACGAVAVFALNGLAPVSPTG